MIEQHTEEKEAVEGLEMRGIRVLVLFGASALQGQERGNIEVLRALKALGLEARFVTCDPWSRSNIEPELRRSGFSFVGAPFGPLLGRNLFGRDLFVVMKGMITTSWIVWREIHRFKPTHLLTPAWLYFVYCAPAILLCHLPLVFRLGDSLSESTLVHRLLWKLIVIRCRFIVCISKFVREELLCLAGGENKSAVIYSHPPQRDPTPSSNVTWKHPQGAVAIAFVGQIAANKGISVLIDAARQLIAEGCNIVVWIAGDYSWNNPLADRLIASVRTDRLDDRIQFLGYVENIPQMLRDADIHVFPSLCLEGLGNVVLEAKAAGIPSVAFPNGGIPELIRDGEDGLLCRASTVTALAESLRMYIKNDQARQLAGAAARQSLLTRFSYNGFQHAWSTVFLKTRR